MSARPPRGPQSPDVVAAIVLGDPSAFEQLFRHHYAELCSFGARYVHDAYLAEELVQDVFTSIWVRRKNLVVDGSIRAYLFSAVRNAALNERKHQRVEADWEQTEMHTSVSPLHSEPETPDVLLERSELDERLRGAMEALPERCRLVMHLRWRDQLSYAEIATVMGISAKGVENQLARGLERLRSLLR